ncbi:hypothetical protein O2W14_07130 [Modestobacter sp. VKM Ac-2986]|uniref:hypothetical protein n=1 Tax=Modestobacter sp. VKM Ac-2986 TaxID=3004140 RepID=UPI0022AB4DFB|nr:hypothetical protein [Modestobacter sp. VKM Ac-2986]MCZ2828601.1 hypothetical protein [Modestobacter sp. VKM Ac-2986]
MSVPTPSRASARAAVGALATLVALALGTSPASAAVGLTVPLSPPDVVLFLYPSENTSPPTEDGGGEFVPVEVEWGGAVDLQLPAGVDASAATYLLETGAETDEEPTRTLSSAATGAGHLDVTGPSDGLVRITLPTDASSGPLGLLTVAGLTGTAPGVEVGADVEYLLEFAGAGTSVVPLAPVLSAQAGLPCTYAWLAEAPEPDVDAGADPGAEVDCSSYAVTAGTTIAFTLPADSLMRTVGLDALTDTTAVFFRTEPDEDGFWAGYEAGYTDGSDAGLQAGLGAVHVPAHGPSFDAAQAAADTGYEQGYDEGHTDGWYEATVPAPEVEPDTDPGFDPDDELSRWQYLIGSLTGDFGIPTSPLAEPAPAEALARVAAAEAVDAAQAAAEAADEPAEQPAPDVSEDVDEEVSVDGGSFGDDTLPVTVTADGIELTVPADSRSGDHALALIIGTDAENPWYSVTLTLDVTAAPVAVAPVVAPPGQPVVVPVLNPGLASNTGWTEPDAGASVPLVAVGGTALLVAALGAGAVLRPRRRPAAAPQD